MLQGFSPPWGIFAQSTMIEVKYMLLRDYAA